MRQRTISLRWPLLCSPSGRRCQHAHLASANYLCGPAVRPFLMRQHHRRRLQSNAARCTQQRCALLHHMPADPSPRAPIKMRCCGLARIFVSRELSRPRKPSHHRRAHRSLHIHNDVVALVTQLLPQSGHRPQRFPGERRRAPHLCLGKMHAVYNRALSLAVHQQRSPPRIHRPINRPVGPGHP